MAKSTNINEIKAKLASLLQKTVENGASEAEAMAALSAANKIAAKYSVSLDDLKNETDKLDFDTRQMQQPTKDVHEVDMLLAVPISKYAGVRCWLDNKAEFPRTTFFGLDADVELAVFLREILKTTMIYEWKIYRTYVYDKSVSMGVARASFMAGFADRIATRLEAFTAANSNTPTGNELIVVKNQLVTTAYNALGLKLRSSRARSVRIDADTYAAGQDSGSRAALGRGVGGGNAGLLT